MKVRPILPILTLLLAATVSAFTLSGNPSELLGSSSELKTQNSKLITPVPPFPDAYKLTPEALEIGVPGKTPRHFTHPCPGIASEPPFEGVSPLAVVYPYLNCQQGNTLTFGDVATWQSGGHDYVAISGFAYRLGYI